VTWQSATVTRAGDTLDVTIDGMAGSNPVELVCAPAPYCD